MIRRKFLKSSLLLLLSLIIPVKFNVEKDIKSTIMFWIYKRDSKIYYLDTLYVLDKLPTGYWNEPVANAINKTLEELETGAWYHIALVVDCRNNEIVASKIYKDGGQDDRTRTRGKV